MRAFEKIMVGPNEAIRFAEGWGGDIRAEGWRD